MKLQTIRKDRVIVNRTYLGQSLLKFSKDNIGFMTKTINAGFLDGGCLAFAVALKSLVDLLSPEKECEIVSVGRTSADHAVLEVRHPKFGHVYLDADGLATKEEICKKMIEVELLSYADIYPFDFEQDQILDYNEIGLPQQLFKRLAASSVASALAEY